MNPADLYIDRVQHLPPAPTVATRLLELLNDPDRDIERIVELISYDPSLTAEMLKRCNSVFFRGTQPSSSLLEAVSRLGFTEVYGLAMALVGSRVLTMLQPGTALDTGKLWRHSVATAVTAATLAARVQEQDLVAFTAGLLHDIGKLVFASAEGTRYGQILGKAGAFGPALVKAERAAFGLTHADLGARLLARWGLPAGITRAVLFHHASPLALTPWEPAVAVVAVANELAHGITGDLPSGTDLSPVQLEALNRLQLSPEDLPTIIEQSEQSLQRVHRLVAVPG